MYTIKYEFNVPIYLTQMMEHNEILIPYMADAIECMRILKKLIVVSMLLERFFWNYLSCYLHSPLAKFVVHKWVISSAYFKLNFI